MIKYVSLYICVNVSVYLALTIIILSVVAVDVERKTCFRTCTPFFLIYNYSEKMMRAIYFRFKFLRIDFNYIPQLPLSVIFSAVSPPPLLRTENN